MNGPQVVAALLCFSFAFAVYLAFEVVIFRISCGLCRIAQPNLFRSVGIVSTLLVIPAIVDTIFGGILYEIYSAVGFPIWEAGLVEVFLVLPIHMALCATIHAKMMDIPISQGLGVWFVEKFLKLLLLIVLLIGVLLILLIRQL